MVLKITKEIDRIISSALHEDIGKKDITTDLLISKDKKVKAVIVCKQKNTVVCGLPIAHRTFQLLDKSILFRYKVKEGTFIKNKIIVAEILGKARAILTAERTALNFLSLLSGIATSTYIFKKKIKPYQVKIMDTRKTHPGLRILEKYAVRIGGGYNHRSKLDEMVLIKDNHLRVLGGIKNLKKIFRKIRKKIPSDIKIEIEVKSIDEFKIAQTLKPHIIMLDNMSLKNIKKIVEINKNRIKLEVSGNVNIKNIKDIAKINVDTISVGAITHSSKARDFSLEIV